MATNDRNLTSTADWRVIDPASLSPSLAAAYTEYRTAYTLMKSARLAFETAMSSAAALPATKRLVYGYNFGKLSIAVVDAPATRKPASSQSASLADFLRSASLTGART